VSDNSPLQTAREKDWADVETGEAPMNSPPFSAHEPTTYVKSKFAG